MSMITRLFAVLAVLVMLADTLATVGARVVQDADDVIDIANVPLPVGDLTEEGYQVLAAGYLDAEAAASWIAEPRQRASGTIAEHLASAGLVDAYVMDHVLLEDRASATSDILALVQTNVFLVADTTGADALYEVMADFSGADVDAAEPAILDSTTVRLASQSGDTTRTVFARDRMVVEVVSLEGFDFVDVEGHRAVVARTADRAERVIASEVTSIAPRAVRLSDGDALADLQNFQQSGVHHLYRIRDGEVQPAAGELNVPAPQDIANGVHQVFHASAGLRIGGGTGTGFMSSWIGEFGSENLAAGFLRDAVDDPAGALGDPYFAISDGEQVMPQGVAGLYRVTGVYDGQPYSGNLEIRQQGAFVVAIGFRTLGSALPPVDVTSRVMDHQLACLENEAECPPLAVSDLLATPSATPVAPTTGEHVLISDEFGWSVRTDVGDWTVVERFAESGYDLVELQSGRSLVTLESVINQHGDPQQCILDELDALQEFESSAVIQLGSDLEEQPAGMEPGHAWAIYTVEPLADERADQEYTIRIDCYTLIDGGANLVVTHRAPRELWGTEREKGDELRETILMSGAFQPDVIIAGATHDWRCDVINKHWIDRAA